MKEKEKLTAAYQESFAIGSDPTPDQKITREEITALINPSAFLPLGRRLLEQDDGSVPEAGVVPFFEPPDE